MRFIPRIRFIIPLALLALLASAGVAGSAATRDVKPFTYIFRVTSVTASGVYTINGATSTIHVHMTAPTKKIYLTWLGKHDGSMHNGAGASGIKFVGTAVFVDPSMPSCNKTFPITSAGLHPFASVILANARDRVVTHPTFYMMVSQFPMVSGYPASNGVCGKVRKDLAEDAHGSFRFPGIVKKRGFTLRDGQPTRDLGDGESIEWKLVTKVRKIRYIPISCAVAKGC